MRRLLFAAIGVVLLRAAPGAQLTTLWTFDELRAKSDVVAIASPGVTRETGIKAELDELQPPLPVVELATDFEVLTVLKGDPVHALVLRHYRLDNERMKGRCLNCGSQADFTASGRDAIQCRAGSPPPSPPRLCPYLLFLKRDADGPFSATSGRVFPTQSFVRMDNAWHFVGPSR